MTDLTKRSVCLDDHVRPVLLHAMVLRLSRALRVAGRLVHDYNQLVVPVYYIPPVEHIVSVGEQTLKQTYGFSATRPGVIILEGSSSFKHRTHPLVFLSGTISSTNRSVPPGPVQDFVDISEQEEQDPDEEQVLSRPKRNRKLPIWIFAEKQLQLLRKKNELNKVEDKCKDLLWRRLQTNHSVS
uniref:Uncharacterized protein n=1 Tax=Timema monikensis TaxID=170555 RepID=A0A7R9E5S9_9NEOP|nr:unnamed protein product [Timema monikensis]